MRFQLYFYRLILKSLGEYLKKGWLCCVAHRICIAHLDLGSNPPKISVKRLETTVVRKWLALYSITTSWFAQSSC